MSPADFGSDRWTGEEGTEKSSLLPGPVRTPFTEGDSTRRIERVPSVLRLLRSERRRRREASGVTRIRLVDQRRGTRRQSDEGHDEDRRLVTAVHHLVDLVRPLDEHLARLEDGAVAVVVHPHGAPALHQYE